MNIEYMKKAIKIAKTSGKDIPVGAIIVKDGEIISKAINQREKRQNAIYHAEILAIRRACRKLKNWRLNDCEIYVTLEPCPMCASAILQARIGKIYYGAYDFLNGAFGSKSDMREIMSYNAEVNGGIMEDECAKLLKDYFERMR